MKPWILQLPTSALRMDAMTMVSLVSTSGKRIILETSTINEDSGIYVDVEAPDQPMDVIKGWSRLMAHGWPSRKCRILEVWDLAWIGREKVWPPEEDEDKPNMDIGLFFPNSRRITPVGDSITAPPTETTMEAAARLTRERNEREANLVERIERAAFVTAPEPTVMSGLGSDLAAAIHGIEPPTQAEKDAIMACSGQTEQVLLHFDKDQIVASIEQARQEGYRVGLNDSSGGRIGDLERELRMANAQILELTTKKGNVVFPAWPPQFLADATYEKGSLVSYFCQCWASNKDHNVGNIPTREGWTKLRELTALVWGRG